MLLGEKLKGVHNLETFLEFNREFRNTIKTNSKPHSSTNVDLSSVLECMEACIIDNEFTTDTDELPKNRWRFAAELLYLGHIYE